MKHKFLMSVFFFSMGLLLSYNNASAKDEPCDSRCATICQQGKSYSANVLGTTQNRCTIGLNKEVLNAGDVCSAQWQCKGGLYCNMPKVGNNTCKSKLAPGAECGSYNTNCGDECQSGKYQKVTVPCPAGQSMCAPSEAKKCTDASGKLPTTTTTPKDNQYYSKEVECKTNCAGGTCTFVTGTSMYRCDLKSTNPGSEGSGSGSSNSTASIKIENPLKFNTVEEFIGVVLTRARQIIVVLSLVFILIGAVMYVASAGNPDMTGKAKGAITAALIGLAIGIAAPSFLKEIGGIVGWNGADNSEVSGALSLSQIATNVLNFLLGIFGVLSMIMLVIGGLTYVTAAGSEERIDKGKKIFTYALIGIVVAMSALVIVKQIAKFFV